MGTSVSPCSAGIVGIAYLYGVLLENYPAVVLTPFFPSLMCLMYRLVVTMPLNPLDGPRFVLNAVRRCGLNL